MNHSKTQFFLARHGETEWNQQRRLQGHLNSALTPSGLEQAKLIADNLFDHSIELIISSPLGRALGTAKLSQTIIKSDLISHENLIERHFGDWQGELFDKLSAKPNFENIFFKVTQHKPPNGESGVACGLRIKNCLSEIAKQYNHKNILIITHGDAIRCFLALLSEQIDCDAYSQYGNGKVFPVSYCHQSQTFDLKS